MKENAAPGAGTLPLEAIEVARRLELSERPILVSHVRLDGDAIASALALAALLREMGKSPIVASDGPVPKVYRFLPGLDEFPLSQGDGLAAGDLVVVLDCPTRARVGRIANRFPSAADVVRIDHHSAREPVGVVEWEDTARSSTGEMAHDLAEQRGWPLTRDAATNLYVAIVTDTGRLTFPNTTPHTVSVCAKLMEAGADHDTARRELYESEDWGVLRLRAEAVLGMSRVLDGRVVVMRLTREMLRRHRVDPIDIHEFADIPRSVSGARVGLLVREMKEPGMVKGSLRGVHGFDLRSVAGRFGGGGHAEAAGFEARGSLAEVEALALAAIEEEMAAQGEGEA